MGTTLEAWTLNICFQCFVIFVVFGSRGQKSFQFCFTFDKNSAKELATQHPIPLFQNAKCVACYPTN